MSRPLAFVLALVLCLAPNLHAIELPREKEKWITLPADDFTIYSNASPRETTEVAVNLLRMRDAIGKVTRLKVRPGIPTSVYVFRNAAAFAPYRAALMPDNRAAVTGVFFNTPDMNFILLQGDSSNGIDSVVYHELTHAFVQNTAAGLPLWFNEGMAEYYSTFSARGTEVSIGKPIPEHVLWLRDEPLIPLAQLFAIHEKSKEYNEGTRTGVFYAQSWALVHYLLAGNSERRPQLTQFLSLLNAKKPVDDAFREAFGVSYQELEKELKQYVMRRAFTYTKYALDELPAAQLAAPSPMPRDEVLYRLGELLARGGEAPPDAEQHLREAIRVNPNHASAHASLGMVLQATGRTDQALAAFERAIALDSKDAGIYLIYGVSLLDRKDARRALPLFEKAVQLAPTAPRAWAGLGASYLETAADDARGIEALERSLQLAPGQEDVAYNLVQLYANAGRRNEAQSLVDRVIAPKGDPELLGLAREALLIADVRRAEDLLQQNKMEEAIAILRPLVAVTTNPDLKAHLTRTIAEAENHTALNAALKLANSGKYKEALAAIDALLPKIQDDAMRTQAKQFRDELAKAVK